MELFIPSLLLLLITALIVYGVMPRLTIPYVLLLSLIVLIVVLRSHYSLFSSEYRYSTWQYIFKDYASFTIIGVLIFMIIIAAITIFSKSRSATAFPTSLIPAAGVLPSATSATNPVTSALNTAIRTVSDTVETATNVASNAVTNTAKMVSNAASAVTGRKNVSSYNLSALTRTPR